jgi:dipeptidyl aminopeptidase/acylaminoacyl peptidase
VTSVPARAREASPVHHVTPGAPPFLLLHGLDDTLVPCAQSETLHAALCAAGVDAELHRYPGADHMWRGAADAATDALDRTADFLAAHLLT